MNNRSSNYLHDSTPVVLKSNPQTPSKSFSTTQIIQRAHKDIPLLELTASRAEAELGECQRMLDMRKEADRRLRHWQNMLAEATKDLTHAEMRLAGQVRRGVFIVPHGPIIQRKLLFGTNRSRVINADENRKCLLQARN